MKFFLLIIRNILLITACLSLLCACTKNENVKGAYIPPTPKTIEGAGLGAVIGAAAGGLVNSTKSPSLLGAAAGAMLGASIGAYYDQEGVLLDLAYLGVTTIRLGDIVEFNIPADLLFEGGDVDLRQSAYPMMGRITAYLQQYGPVGIAVEGYTDSIGSTFDKLRRSELQAQSVSTYLWTHGVNLERIHYVGMGDTINVAQQNTTLGSAYNRRVTITLWRDEAPSSFKTYAKLQREDCWTRDDPDTC